MGGKYSCDITSDEDGNEDKSSMLRPGMTNVNATSPSIRGKSIAKGAIKAKTASSPIISKFSSKNQNKNQNQNQVSSNNNDNNIIPVASLRRGKWTYEEEAYVMKMIEFFQEGLLQIAAGTTLR